MRVKYFTWRGQGNGHVLPIIFLFFFALVFMGGCDRRSSVELPLKPSVTHPLTREFIGFGVVNVSFIHLLNEPGPGGVSQGYLRRGTVVRILERRSISRAANFEMWVFAEGNYETPGRISRGWLPEARLYIFNNESQAITASNAMSR